jgi:hypothetical protein
VIIQLQPIKEDLGRVRGFEHSLSKNYYRPDLKINGKIFTRKLDFQSSTKFPYTYPIIFFPTDKYKNVGNVTLHEAGKTKL